MIDIDQVARLLMKNPNGRLVYSMDKRRFYDLTSTDVNFDGDEIYVLRDNIQYYNDAKRVFRQNHRDIFPNPPSKYSIKKWNEIIEKSDLSFEWFLEIRRSLARAITAFSKDFGIAEVEATKDLYDCIKDELEIFRDKHYEKKYSSDLLFHFNDGYENNPMTILGHFGDITGVGFYPGDARAEGYLLAQNSLYLKVDPNTGRSLSNMLSFYFEEEKIDYGFDNNPFGNDGLITSCYICGGCMMNCYLPKSLAIRALSFLMTINKVLPLFEEERKDFNFQRNKFYYDAYLNMQSFPVIEKDVSFGVEELFSEIDYTHFEDMDLDFSAKGSFDASIRVLPGGLPDENNPQHCRKLAYVAIFCDSKTGKVVINQSGVANNCRPFDGLCHSLKEKLEASPLPKKIKVNSFLDYVFFSDLFRPYIDERKVKIVVEMKQLMSDIAFDELGRFFQEEEEPIHYA